MLPGVPQLKGAPILGALPLCIRLGIPNILSKLIAIGDEGISYVKIGNTILVSIHEPIMVRTVMTYSDEIATR